MKATELRRRAANVCLPDVEVHGLGPMLYAVYVVTDGGREPLQDERGRTWTFPSRHAAQRALGDLGLSRATFVHTSPYGEMIGMDGIAGDTELRETLILDPRAPEAGPRRQS